MEPLHITAKSRIATIVFLLSLYFNQGVNGWNSYTVDGSRTSFLDPDIVSLEHVRIRRDTPAAPLAHDAPAPVPAPVPAPSAPAPAGNVTSDANRTASVTTDGSTQPTVSVTQIPLLGENGTGILRVNTTGSTAKVSDPILPDDNTDIADMFHETPEMMKAEQNITNLKYDNHEFYNSTFYGNKTYFDEYWANLTKHASDVHPILSNSHRRATTLTLKFDFPFYGHGLRNITVATGGFIYTGDHVHNWLAATQYIAPLMANFDTTLTNDSYVKMYNSDDKFTAFWENVTVQEDTSKKFTFAVTLYNNGDIEFAYKSIPIPVQNISDSDHPVKVGISDAYLNDRIFFLIRRKTIYEYHRVSFMKKYEIANSTILRLTALPTCLQYDSCETCVNHDTGFDCMWCEAIHKCSSGTDRHKQDWMMRNCDKIQVSNETGCPAPVQPSSGHSDTGNTAYVTDGDASAHAAVVNTLSGATKAGEEPRPPVAPHHARVSTEQTVETRSPIGGVVAAFVAITLVSGLAAWALYAFKNPHTRSGQLLIKYRPSQWSWRRGEARYTAATIHM